MGICEVDIQACPCLIPKHHALGRFKAPGRITYFYLSEFIHFKEPETHRSSEKTKAPKLPEAPDPDALATKIAEFHQKSESPTGKFGFHVTTCDEKWPNTVEWEESWTVFYAKLLRNIFNIDLEAKGPRPKLERAAEQVITKVIPRLLGNIRGPDGSPLKPRLIHGDLWEPNLGVNKATGQLVLCDVSSCYAHNEVDLGQWWAHICVHLGASVDNLRRYMGAYKAIYPESRPREEFEDRNMLYSLKGSLNYSAGHPNCGIRDS